MSTRVNNNDLLLRAAMQKAAETAANRRVNTAVTSTPAQVNQAVVGTPVNTTTGEVNTSTYFGNINKLSEKYGTKAPATEAAAATYAAPVQAAKTEPADNLTKVNDAKVAIAAKSASKTELQSALNLNAKLAGLAYANNKMARATVDEGKYDALKGASINEINGKSQVSAFQPASGSDYTLGLSFGGNKNIFNKSFMEIC